MNKQQRIKNIIDYLSTDNAYLINNKKLVIKNSRTNITPLASINNFQSYNIFITNKLLQPEDRIPRKNILLWVDELSNNLNQQIYSSKQINENISTIFNQTALVFCLVGNIKMAIEICKKQIKLAIASSLKNPNSIRFVIQPLINLGRVYRIQGLYKKALSIFNKLMEIKLDHVTTIDNFVINDNILLDATNAHHDYAKSINNCKYLELIKTYLLMGEFNSIKHLIDLILSHNDFSLYPIAYEAAIITQCYYGKINQAYAQVIEALEKLSPQLEHIFLFRQAEIIFSKDKNLALEILTKLVQLIEYKFASINDVNLVNFSAELSLKIKLLGCNDLAIKSFQNTLDFATKIEDEPLIILCLDALQNLSPSKAQQEKLESYLNKTDYITILNKFKKPFSINKNNHLKLNEKLALLENTLTKLT